MNNLKSDAKPLKKSYYISEYGSLLEIENDLKAIDKMLNDPKENEYQRAILWSERRVCLAELEKYVNDIYN